MPTNPRSAAKQRVDQIDGALERAEYHCDQLYHFYDSGEEEFEGADYSEYTGAVIAIKTAVGMIRESVAMFRNRV